jgi:catechol 2,3-dioxygenase-like lactoylglutathione lyase family enzyme
MRPGGDPPPKTDWSPPEVKRKVPAMIRGIDHINIVVADLARSVKFYTEVLGFRKTHDVVMEGDWIEAIVGLRGVKGLVAFVEAPGNGPRIELLQYVSPPGVALPENSRPQTRGLRHLALRVDDIVGLTARLRAAGVTLFSDPVRVPAGVVKFAAGDKTLVYFLDPDGVILELAEYR